MNEKKVKEGSLGSSTDDTDVFSEEMESADCKQFYWAVWKSKVKEIFDLANTTNKSYVKR